MVLRKALPQNNVEVGSRNLTVLVNHDVIDGIPAARFVDDLVWKAVTHPFPHIALAIKLNMHLSWLPIFQMRNALEEERVFF